MRRRRCDVPCPALFDLGDVELQQVVKPCDQFLPVWERQSAHALVVRGRRMPGNLVSQPGASLTWTRPSLDVWECGLGGKRSGMECDG